MSNGVLAIAVTDAGLAIKDDMNTEDMLKATMKRMHEFWLTTDDDVRLRGAVGAVLSYLGKEHEDYDDIVASLDALRKASAVLNALQAGVQVDLSNQELESPRFKLMDYWRAAS